jgi:hypothetical protein
VGTFFIAGTAIAAGRLSERWHAGFAPFYDRMFERGLFTALAPSDRAPERICVLDFRPYPFFGSRRQHRVCQPHRPSSAADFYDYILDHDVTLIAGRFDFDLRSRGWENCPLYLTDRPELFTSAKKAPWPYTVFRTRSSSIPPDRTANAHP